MGDRTQLERVMELESAGRVLEERLNGITALVGMLVSRADVEDKRQAAINERMAKARAGRKRGKKRTIR